jgi:hypothetical protein
MHRSRKSIVMLAAALAGVLGMAGVAAAAHGSSPKQQAASGHHQRRRHGGTTSTSSAPTSSTSASSPSTTVSVPAGVTTTSEVEHARPEPGDDNGVDPAAHAAKEAAEASDVNDANDVNDDNGNDHVTSTTVAGATTTSMPDAPTTSTTIAPVSGVQTFTVTGGTVTVDIEGGNVSLVSVTPAAGFTVDKSEARADRVEVEFRDGQMQSRVRVRLDNGRLRVETGDH